MKATLVNFTDWHVSRLLEMGIVSSNQYTLWDNGSSEITPTEDTNFIFIDAKFSDHTSSSLHTGSSKKFEQYVRNGGIIVVFINNVQNFHLENLIGLPPHVTISKDGGNIRSIKAAETPFLSIFSTYGNRISSSASLLNRRAFPDFSVFPELPAQYEVLAYQQDIQRVISLKYQLDRGFYLFLPNFGNENMDIMKLLITSILPNSYPDLFEQPINSWTANEEYLLPEIKKVIEDTTSVHKRHEKEKAELQAAYKTVWSEKQEPYLKLITTQGGELKNSVAMFFREIGYYVIDVDEYFKSQGKEKSLEEDLWILNDKVEILDDILKREDLRIVEVKGIKHTPKDEDATAINKYVHKRNRQSKNSQITGIFVVNHQMGIPAFRRKKAFRQMIIDNAAEEGALLISTDILFRYIKAIKSGDITREDVKKIIDTNSGELEFKTTV